MNIALFALAAVMIVGGIVSVIQGFPFVRLESGLAMTIAGATTASAGAVVLGLAVIAHRLGGLARALPRAGALGPLAEAEAGEAGSFEPEPGAPARQRPSLAATAASLGGLTGAGLGAAAATRAGREPTFFDPAPPPKSATAEANPAEPLLPNLLPDDGASPSGSDGRSEPVFFAAEGYPAEADLLFGTPEPMVSDAPRAPEAPATGMADGDEPEPAPVARVIAEPEAPPASEPEPVTGPHAPIETAEFTELPAAPEPAPEPPPVEDVPFVDAEPQVVGTYASGGNTYVMYATGVIEAETPRGRYTFASLDELKAFVEAGGESDARGAA